jgi:hypothetical protein
VKEAPIDVVCAMVPGFDGWYTRLFYESDWDMDGSTEYEPVIADVHTQPADEGGAIVGRVLHVGTGFPRLLVVTVDTCVGPRAYAGLSASYFEQITTDFERLTDEAWTAELASAPPDEVPWLSRWSCAEAAESAAGVGGRRAATRAPSSRTGGVGADRATALGRARALALPTAGAGVTFRAAWCRGRFRSAPGSAWPPPAPESLPLTHPPRRPRRPRRRLRQRRRPRPAVSSRQRSRRRPAASTPASSFSRRYRWCEVHRSYPPGPGLELAGRGTAARDALTAALNPLPVPRRTPSVPSAELVPGTSGSWTRIGTCTGTTGRRCARKAWSAPTRASTDRWEAG